MSEVEQETKEELIGNEVPSCIREELALLEQQESFLHSIVPSANKVIELVEELTTEGLEIDVKIGCGPNVLQGVLVWLSVKDNMDEVTLVLRRLAELGFAKRGEPDDSSDMKRRVYRCEGDVKLMAFFYESGATCKFVKVGEKTVPQYKLQCGDENNGGQQEG